MSVEFNEPVQGPSRGTKSKPPFFYGAIIATGLAKDEDGARIIAIGVALLCIALAIGIFVSMGAEPPPPPEPPEPY